MLSFCLQLKHHNEKKCQQIGDLLQKGKLSLSDPRLSELHDHYFIEGS